MADDAASWCIDFAYVEAGCLFVFGWFVEQGPRFQGLLLHLNGQHVDLGRNAVRVPRPDVAPVAPSARRASNDHGLIIAADIGAAIVPGDSIELWVVLPDGTVTPIGAETSANQARFVHFARGNLLNLLQLLGTVPPEQRAKLATIAERARAPVDAAAAAEADPLRISFICAPVADVIVVLGRIADPRRHPAPIELLGGETKLRRRLRLIQAADGSSIFLMVGEAGGAVPHERFVVSQVQGNGHQRAVFPRADVPAGLAALDALLLQVDADVQITVLEELADVFAARPEPADLARLKRLWADRADRLGLVIDRPGNAVQSTTRLVIDKAWQVGPHGVFLMGWLLCDRDALRSVAFRVPGMPPFELHTTWIEDQRHDVWRALRDAGVAADTDQLGFTCFVPVSLADDVQGCTLAMTMRDGAVLRLRLEITPTPDDPLALIRRILTSFSGTHRDVRRLLDRHVGPAIGALWSGRRRVDRAPDVLQFGAPPPAPDVSVVVPIYGRADFIEFQLAQFANDPSMRTQDLIYVIDDPSIYDAVRTSAADLFGCYAVPFRLVYGQRNAGFAMATNLGAAQARAALLLLLNSDVLPRGAGWLDRLVAEHRRLDAGAVSPKLLYEDGSIQHAGMAFFPLPMWDGLWVNDHPLKGQPNSPAADPVRCEALTGACLLVSTDLYRELGGLSEDYIIGDFEDSDLCLQLRRAGLQNWLIPSVELFHLERQSQNMVGENDWRANLTLYNCWLHNDRWGTDIARIAGAA